jgi:hypothetical protein
VPSPLSFGSGVTASLIQIPKPLLQVYQRQKPCSTGLVSPAFGVVTDWAIEWTDFLILSAASFVCKTLVNSFDFLSKFFLILHSAAFLSFSLFSAFFCASSHIFFASCRDFAYSPDIWLPSALAFIWTSASSWDLVCTWRARHCWACALLWSRNERVP